MESDSGYEYEDDGYQAKKVSSNMGLPPRHNHAVSYGQNMWIDQEPLNYRRSA